MYMVILLLALKSQKFTQDIKEKLSLFTCSNEYMGTVLFRMIFHFVHYLLKNEEFITLANTDNECVLKW